MRSDGTITLPMVMLWLGRIGGADNDVVPKFSTATASKNSVTPTDAHTLVSGAACSNGR